MNRNHPILNVRHLRLERGGIIILDDVNWRVAGGEHWAILGANGSGKTSLLSAITGYSMPTSGEIDLLGLRYGEADWRELRCHVGLVSTVIRQRIGSQETALDTVITGRRAMIDLWGRVSVAERREARGILADIECSHVENRLWGFLSQGERQRVLIGRALMARPRLLILDEPCAGLDPAARESFLLFLNRLGRRAGSPTLVLVTHHVEEIMPVFTHTLVLRGGRVLAGGRKQTVLTARTLASAFGVQCRLRRSGGRYALRVAPRRNVVI